MWYNATIINYRKWRNERFRRFLWREIIAKWKVLQKGHWVSKENSTAFRKKVDVLLDGLNSQERKLFEEIENEICELYSQAERDVFKTSFSLGIKMALEIEHFESEIYE